MRFDFFPKISHIDNFEQVHRHTASRGDGEYLKQRAEERLQRKGKAIVVWRKGSGVLGTVPVSSKSSALSNITNAAYSL